ncbi:NADPH-dependent FMN reductase [Natrialba swarupiae]|uniref:Uncharacterized protein n=1 Tax=Natrialba swarupiae TaxID=2448032 RepID=A0A5D5AS07_9EURY|nr:hypothetical protein [Natrialba swarupiae]TYT63787.1 hypothetical protein FYC77_00760 [Natrialba swarupiae]
MKSSSPVGVRIGLGRRDSLEHLRSVSRTLNAWTIPHQVGIPNSHAAFEDGELVEDDVTERVDLLGETVFEYAGVERYPELESSEPTSSA